MGYISQRGRRQGDDAGKERRNIAPSKVDSCANQQFVTERHPTDQKQLADATGKTCRLLEHWNIAALDQVVCYSTLAAALRLARAVGDFSFGKALGNLVVRRFTSTRRGWTSALLRATKVPVRDAHNITPSFPCFLAFHHAPIITVHRVLDERQTCNRASTRLDHQPTTDLNLGKTASPFRTRNLCACTLTPPSATHLHQHHASRPSRRRPSRSRKCPPSLANQRQLS